MPSTWRKLRMDKTVVQRAFTLTFAVFMLTGCFSTSTPKDLVAFTDQTSDSNGVLTLDASPPTDPGSVVLPADTYVAPEDTAMADSKADGTSAPDIMIPDFSVTPDTTTEDTTTEDIGEDTALADVTEDITGPEDTSETDSWTEDTNPQDTSETDSWVEDTATIDGPAPCEGINCPGTQAPAWSLEDFQPESPWFKESYGLEKFQGKVTVMVLLAGW